MKAEPIDTDITMLRGTLAWMDLVMANIDESIFVVNKDWEIVYVNDTLADILGMVRVTMLGKRWFEVIPLEKDDKPVDSVIDFEKQSIVDAGKLNGIYRLQTFQVNRVLSLTTSHITSVNQTVCVLADVTMEMNAFHAIRDKDDEIFKLRKSTKVQPS